MFPCEAVRQGKSVQHHRSAYAAQPPPVFPVERGALSPLAGKIGPNTGMVVSAILSGYKVEQQGYKSCLGLLKLADKYSPQRLEGACTRALTFTPRPSLKNIQAILASGQDRLPVEESAKTDTSA